MKSNAEKNKDLYISMAAGNANKTVIAGRYAFDEGKEQFIVDDIIAKLDFKQGSSFFDIGCGAGFVAESLIKTLYNLDIAITAMDVAEIIDVLNKGFITKASFPGLKMELLKGYYPGDYTSQEKFDRILLYSVLHSTDNPFEIIEEAVRLLKPYGKILLGDLPNINRKGRFLASGEGRMFEANYRNTTVDKIPFYSDHHDFVQKMKDDQDYYSMIDDEFIDRIHKQYTNSGFDVFILPQPESLPFSKTRHDVLICKYD
ncbi:MAG: methyltransferase domain-containing protein [Ginsengibacter sp.]